MKENTIKKIIEYFKEEEDLFNSCIEELDSYNGYLNDSRYYEMDELNDIYSGTDARDILFRAFYGYDEDSYTIDEHGEKHYKEFNPNKYYFSFNGYGNLISSDYKDYSAFLDSYAIEEMSENRYYIDSIEDDPDLAALFDELEEEEEEEE
ncbi:MAG: hypothetical protein IKT93_05035 [Clostridia bacterium]|nr:hypothetical protein [Clostridia bacterium]